MARRVEERPQSNAKVTRGLHPGNAATLDVLSDQVRFSSERHAGRRAAIRPPAESTFHPSNDENSSIMHVVQRADPLWVYTGNEGGWELRAHAYELRGGRVVHADKLAHDTPRPAIESQPDLPIDR